MKSILYELNTISNQHKSAEELRSQLNDRLIYPILIDSLFELMRKNLAESFPYEGADL